MYLLTYITDRKPQSHGPRSEVRVKVRGQGKGQRSGSKSQVRVKVTGQGQNHRSGSRSQVRVKVTGQGQDHRSGSRSQVRVKVRVNVTGQGQCKGHGSGTYINVGSFLNEEFNDAGVPIICRDAHQWTTGFRVIYINILLQRQYKTCYNTTMAFYRENRKG